MNLSVLTQALSCAISALAAYAAYRARDNERAATLSEMRAEIRQLSRRMERLENALIRRSELECEKRRESA